MKMSKIKMTRMCIVLCLALAGILMFGCGKGGDTPTTYTPPPTEEGGGEGAEPQGGTPPQAAENENELLSFDPSTFFFGKKYSEIEAEFTDLEDRGSMSGGEYYYSPSAEIFFIFDVNDIGDPENPDKDALISANTMPAKLIFPKMGEQVDKAAVERIVGTGLDDSIDDFGSPTIFFTYQGYVFWYNSEGTPDLLSGTLVTVKEES